MYFIVDTTPAHLVHKSNDEIFLTFYFEKCLQTRSQKIASTSIIVFFNSTAQNYVIILCQYQNVYTIIEPTHVTAVCVIPIHYRHSINHFDLQQKVNHLSDEFHRMIPVCICVYEGKKTWNNDWIEKNLIPHTHTHTPQPTHPHNECTARDQEPRQPLLESRQSFFPSWKEERGAKIWWDKRRLIESNNKMS